MRPRRASVKWASVKGRVWLSLTIFLNNPREDSFPAGNLVGKVSQRWRWSPVEGRWPGASLPPILHAPLIRPLRFETLEPEMNALAARITAVNDIAEQLLKANPPGKDRIVNTQKQLNNRCAGEGSPGH